ncbi:hypothetical protein [Streptomyces sp. OE57]|uniref:hypothetical protein n=1 Tax=Streptomyces lacaronensis TaxID=3379885 RepID=UPI0039B73392
MQTSQRVADLCLHSVVDSVRVENREALAPEPGGPRLGPADSDGQNTAAGAPYERAHPAILAWTESSAADRGRNELTLRDLKAMQRS